LALRHITVVGIDLDADETGGFELRGYV